MCQKYLATFEIPIKINVFSQIFIRLYVILADHKVLSNNLHVLKEWLFGSSLKLFLVKLC